MTDAEVKEIEAGLAVAQAKTDRLLDRMAEDADRRQQELHRIQAKTDRRLQTLT